MSLLEHTQYCWTPKSTHKKQFTTKLLVLRSMKRVGPSDPNNTLIRIPWRYWHTSWIKSALFIKRKARNLVRQGKFTILQLFALHISFSWSSPYNSCISQKVSKLSRKHHQLTLRFILFTYIHDTNILIIKMFDTLNSNSSWHLFCLLICDSLAIEESYMEYKIQK